jgi:succinate dehydrogenase / fumarate reductase, cytochrome b subunit
LKVKLAYTTIAQKLVVGLSGLLLVGFLITHLAGNLLLYSSSGDHKLYNDYAHMLHANPLLPLAEIGLLVLFLAHIVVSLTLVVRNRRARPQDYAVKQSKRGKTAVTAHNIMHVTGLIVLLFVVLHLVDFQTGITHPVHEGQLPAERAIRILRSPLSASVYTLGVLLLGYHLYHGIQSGFQTIGASNPKVTPYIRAIGIVLAVVFALGFASFPIWANFLLRK